MITSIKISLDTWHLMQKTTLVGTIVQVVKTGDNEQRFSASTILEGSAMKLGRFPSLYAAKRAIKHSHVDESAST